jgi:hypothetical protein
MRPPSPKSRYGKEEIKTVKSVGLTPLFSFFVERIKFVDFYSWMHF